MKPAIVHAINRLDDTIRTREDANALPREAAGLLHGLLLASGAKSVLEVGTSYGYSGLWIGAAMEQNHGRLTTIDRDPAKVRAARETFDMAGLSDVITVVEAEADDALAEWQSPVDFVLLDAEKHHCRAQVEMILPHLAKRGAVLVDNTLTHADELAAYVEWIRGQSEFFSTHLSIGNGMEYSVRWPSSARSQGIFGL